MEFALGMITASAIVLVVLALNVLGRSKKTTNPQGRRGIMSGDATYGGLFQPDQELTWQTEIREVERRGDLVRVWIDKKTTTGISGYDVARLLPAWVPDNGRAIIWLETREEAELRQAQQVYPNAQAGM